MSLKKTEKACRSRNSITTQRDMSLLRRTNNKALSPGCSRKKDPLMSAKWCFAKIYKLIFFSGLTTITGNYISNFPSGLRLPVSVIDAEEGTQNNSTFHLCFFCFFLDFQDKS